MNIWVALTVPDESSKKLNLGENILRRYGRRGTGGSYRDRSENILLQNIEVSKIKKN